MKPNPNSECVTCTACQDQEQGMPSRCVIREDETVGHLIVYREIYNIERMADVGYVN